MAFDSLVNSLQILDLSGNNLTHLHHKLFNKFDVLRYVCMSFLQIITLKMIELLKPFIIVYILCVNNRY